MKAGRPLKYETPEQLQKAVDEYFETNPDKPTQSGLALALGFEDRQSLYDYKGREDKKSVVINKAMDYMRSKRPARKLGIKFENANQYNLERYHKDPLTNIRVRINSHIRYKLKNKKRGGLRHLPYTLTQLKAHLEANFKEGMSWDNMGEWHIDHIIPASRFNFKSVTDPSFLSCYSLTNLKPMWANDNLRKGSTLTNEVQISIGL